MACTARVLFVAGVFLFLSSATGHAASFIIQLMNGKEYRVSSYWLEQDQIWFRFCGGVVGVPRQDVKSVRKFSDRNLSPNLESESCESPPEEASDVSARRSPDAVSENSESDSVTSARYGKELQELVQKLEGLRNPSRTELITLKKEGEHLRRKMMAESDVQSLRPLLHKLDEELDKIEEAYELQHASQSLAEQKR